MDFTFTPYSPDMTFTELPYKVFDCDFHFYETADAFTRYLPKEYQGLVRLANIDGRTKMIIRGPSVRLHPEPHLRGGGRARVRHRVLLGPQHRGQELPRDRARRCGPSPSSPTATPDWP